MLTFRPMLATDADPKLLRFPLFASPKLDGIRASVVNGKLLTRTLKEVPNRHVFEMLSHERFEGLDGELIVGDPWAHDVYRQTVSGVMSIEGTPKLTYYVFDLHDYLETYTTRLALLRDRVGSFSASVIRVHEQVHINDHDALLAYEAKCLEAGYEGLIVRSGMAPYKFGRSTAKEGYLLKLKRFKDSEAEVLEVIEEMANTNEAKTNALGRTERSSAKAGKVGKGRMGALRVRDIHTGVEFELGTGFNDADKAWWWPRRHVSGVGLIVKYKFFPVGVKDKPRHPVYLGLRDRRDL